MTLHRQPDYPGEAYFLLCGHFSGEIGPALVERTQKKSRDIPQGGALEAMYAEAFALHTAMQAHIPADAQTRWLFTPGESIGPPATALFLRRLLKHPRSHSGLYTTLLDTEAQTPARFANGADFFAWTQRLSIPGADKLALCRLYFEYPALAAHYDRVTDEMAGAIAAHLQSRPNPYLQAMLDEAAERIKHKGPRFLEDLGLVLDTAHTYTIYPMLYRPDQATVLGVAREYNPGARVYIGYALFQYASHAGTAKDAQARSEAFCKILNDPTKFAILQLLKDEALYAAQLAKALQLTNATISHHMNVLVSGGLVKIDKAGNRVYYRRDEGALREQMALLRSALSVEG